MIQAHGENFFHTRPYARTDPSAATFSAALQAMGVATPPAAKGAAAAAAYPQDGQAQGAAAAGLLPSPPNTHHLPHPHQLPHGHRHNAHDPGAPPPLTDHRPAPGDYNPAPRPLFSPTHNL